MLKKLACKIEIFMKIKYELYSDEGLSSHYFETFPLCQKDFSDLTNISLLKPFLR